MRIAKMTTYRRIAAGMAFSLALAGWDVPAHAAATIVINNADPAGVGFNDPTPVPPVGGNTGTTLGQQRQIAFAYAANIWGATLTSSVTIIIQAQFAALTCTTTGAVLGSAGATQVFSDFTGTPKSGTWYPFALANKIAGADLDPGFPQINARFNRNLGQPGCLTGTFFYLGLDNNHGSNIDFVAVLLHELGHGLGFQTFTNGSTGAKLVGLPSVWDHFLLDDTTNKHWVDMTDAERAASAINPGKLSWDGLNVGLALPGVLAQPPRLNISGPAAGSAAGDYVVGTASFGSPLSGTPVIGQLMPVVDQANGSGLACTPLSARNALAVNGRIALVDRGTCAFVIKAKNVQNAGAIGIVVVNNVSGAPTGMGGTDPTITIPAVMISLADGNTLKSKLAQRSRTASGVVANLGVYTDQQYAGADPSGRALMYTPNPYQLGSSVSHWDTIASPNQLMEPAINSDLTHSVVVPDDLTFELLKDIGW